MKTPREILLARHHAATPKLDAIRQQVVNNRFRQGTSLLQLLWRELIWSSHRTWIGLATIWILILVVNVSTRDHSPASMAKALTSPQVVMSLPQEEKLLAELSGTGEAAVAEPQKPSVPQPTSRRPFATATT